MIIKLLSSLANVVQIQDANIKYNEKNKFAHDFCIDRRIPFCCGFLDRNSHWAATPASRHRSAAGSAWAWLFLGRRLLVPRREALQMA